MRLRLKRGRASGWVGRGERCGWRSYAASRPVHAFPVRGSPRNPRCFLLVVCQTCRHHTYRRRKGRLRSSRFVTRSPTSSFSPSPPQAQPSSRPVKLPVLQFQDSAIMTGHPSCLFYAGIHTQLSTQACCCWQLQNVSSRGRTFPKARCVLVRCRPFHLIDP